MRVGMNGPVRWISSNVCMFRVGMVNMRTLSYVVVCVRLVVVLSSCAPVCGTSSSQWPMFAMVTAGR